jgi:hypothetical protein
MLMMLTQKTDDYTTLNAGIGLDMVFENSIFSIRRSKQYFRSGYAGFVNINSAMDNIMKLVNRVTFMAARYAFN